MTINNNNVSPRFLRKRIKRLRKHRSDKFLIRAEVDTLWIKSNQINIDFLSKCSEQKGKRLKGLSSYFGCQRGYICKEFNGIEFFHFSKLHSERERSTHFIQVNAGAFRSYSDLKIFSEAVFGVDAETIEIQRIDVRVAFDPEKMPVEMLFRCFSSNKKLFSQSYEKDVGVSRFQVGTRDKVFRVYDARYSRSGWNRAKIPEARLEVQFRSGGVKCTGMKQLADLSHNRSWKPFSEYEFFNIWSISKRASEPDRRRAKGLQETSFEFNYWFARGQRRYRQNSTTVKGLFPPLRPSSERKSLTWLLNDKFQHDFCEWLDRK